MRRTRWRMPGSASCCYGWAGPDWAPWYYQRGGGSLFDLGVYNITSLTGLLGPARRIMAMAGIAIPERVGPDGSVVLALDEDAVRRGVRRLKQLGLLTLEVNEHEYRFQDVIDVETREVLFTVEHEVRSQTHSLYGRPLANRNPAQSNRDYKPGHDTISWAME